MVRYFGRERLESQRNLAKFCMFTGKANTFNPFLPLKVVRWSLNPLRAGRWLRSFSSRNDSKLEQSLQIFACGPILIQQTKYLWVWRQSDDILTLFGRGSTRQYVRTSFLGFLAGNEWNLNGILPNFVRLLGRPIPSIGFNHSRWSDEVLTLLGLAVSRSLYKDILTKGTVFRPGTTGISTESCQILYVYWEGQYLQSVFTTQGGQMKS